MEQFIKNVPQEFSNEQKAKEYLLRYLSELKLHFNLNDEKIIKILGNSYLQLNKESLVQKWLSMIKSFLHLRE